MKALEGRFPWKFPPKVSSLEISMEISSEISIEYSISSEISIEYFMENSVEISVEISMEISLENGPAELSLSSLLHSPISIIYHRLELCMLRYRGYVPRVRIVLYYGNLKIIYFSGLTTPFWVCLGALSPPKITDYVRLCI